MLHINPNILTNTINTMKARRNQLQREHRNPSEQRRLERQITALEAQRDEFTGKARQ